MEENKDKNSLTQDDGKEVSAVPAEDSNKDSNEEGSFLSDSSQPEKEEKGSQGTEGAPPSPQDISEAVSQEITEKPKKRKRGKVILVTFLLLAVLVCAAYFSVGIYYRSHFLPNTVINGIDCSGRQVDQAAELLDARIPNYALEVTGREPSTGASGFPVATIMPEDIQMVFVDTQGILEGLLADQEWLLWGKALVMQGHAYDFEQGVAYDEEKVEALVKDWYICQSGNMAAPQDAYISQYSDEIQGYEIVPEINGTELDVEKVVQCVKDALSRSDPSLDLEEAGVYVEAEITQDDRRLTEPVETANRWLSTFITYDWNGNEVTLDAETIKDWVSIQEGQAIIDEGAVASFVKEQARKYDTYGKTKKFVTTSGVELSLTSASYGWRTDREAEAEELLQLIQEGSKVSREPVYTHRGMIKVADSVNDIGDSYVEADLTNQHLYLYQEGEIVLETDFVSGKISNGNGTPAGIFGITYKTTNAVLRGQNYETPVNYWMPFYGNYGMHDATWRAAFGGDIYLNNGSHGCINLPKSMAEQIYGYVFAGFPVICYYYEQPVSPEGEELPDPETAAFAEGTATPDTVPSAEGQTTPPLTQE